MPATFGPLRVLLMLIIHMDFNILTASSSLPKENAHHKGIANETDLLCVVGAVIVLEQPLQRHPALNVLVVECCVVVFALERAVPVVLDAVVCPSRQQLSNHRPLVAMCLPQGNPCPQKEGLPSESFV